MNVAIIDYDSGNLHSALKAFERSAQAIGSNSKIALTSDPEAVRRADHIVLPGVGAYADCLSGLRNVEGMVEALDEAVNERGKPFLGICVGMQLLSTRGYEYKVSEGLDWISGDVRIIEPRDKTLKIPHMGWNTLNVARAHPLLDGIPTGPDGWHAYFVHSYAFTTSDPEMLAAEVDYGGAVTAMVAKDNIAGTQFHPEKSQKLGLKLIENFLQWRP